MSRYYSYINSAKEIIAAYSGLEPFASHLKKQFAANKKFGSKDRKQITQLCYCYFRLGRSLQDISLENKLLAGLFLSSRSSSDLLLHLKPEWNDVIEMRLEKKLELLNSTVNASSIFPFTNELSDGIDAAGFAFSHLQQPDLFLRIRPGRKDTVLHQLKAADVSFQVPGDNTVALLNATKIEEVIMLNKDAVVQDYSSQRVGEFLEDLKSKIENQKWNVWDCCAASGGKSIMAKDILVDINLTVSDVRESILINLKKRFQEAGIKDYKSFIRDLSLHSPLTTNHSPFDLIIADVPCSGSGTWGRTPEQLSFFPSSSIETYSALQKKIVSNTVAQLKSNGYYLYITCSVFKKENEDNVAWMQEELRLQLLKQEVIKGYAVKADTMFAALLKKG
ncbi:RsmB/NOP family class I SAM-dependent RNA methyltransferase [Lacibacter sediminis]|uniref:Fmu (Sun) domain-containing protein n=1 Tax=Lacibacter sediminis TaxID=2760713 RepID=A0A7G5XCZ5_9BACT|nr:Fmu (Sun) domain-containing protein [Lacibacter sediminis]QNA43348.1 Fmu (Sun) domain-containing protein [Lacibacter sediminis]